MKFATLPNGTRDGRLHVVARDLSRAAPAQGVETLQALIEDWEAHAPALSAQYDQVNDGAGEPFDPATALAPLPRAWQWLDGSAYDSHGNLMDKVFGMEDKFKPPFPYMYQGVSNQFYAPTEDVKFRLEEDFIDFEGEFGIIVDDVPMGTPADQAGQHIRLIVQINDWSLRRIAPIEMKGGFGWVTAKPPCSMAPVAVIKAATVVSASLLNIVHPPWFARSAQFSGSVQCLYGLRWRQVPYEMPPVGNY